MRRAGVIPVLVSGLFVVSRSSRSAMSSSARECNSAASTINSTEFYATYHGHDPEHLRSLHHALSSRGATQPRVVFFAGDSSLDNKHWLFRPSKAPNKVRRLTTRQAKSYTAAAINGYEDVLEPKRMVKDVAYWLNSCFHQQQQEEEGTEDGRSFVCINASVEEATVADREQQRGPDDDGLLPQDVFIRDSITEDDVLVVSVGGNDIALHPSVATIASMAWLARLTPSWLVGYYHPAMYYFRRLFRDRVQRYVSKLVAKRKPALVLVCMVYFPLEETSGGWADRVLGLLDYDNNPAKLQLIVRQIFEHATSAIEVEGVEAVVPVPLFDVLDSTDPRDYDERVEPSVEGGRKMGRCFCDIILNHFQESDDV